MVCAIRGTLLARTGQMVFHEDGELDLLALSVDMLATSADNNVPFLLKLLWDSVHLLRV